MTCVSWDDANAYAAWLSQKTGHSYRLLSEAEWEYAARAGTVTPFYWGSDTGKGNADCAAAAANGTTSRPRPPAPSPPIPSALYDISGNVRQWTADCGNNNYTGAPKDGTAWMTADCSNHVQRGGSWGGATSSVRTAFRGGGSATGNRASYYGFRVARVL